MLTTLQDACGSYATEQNALVHGYQEFYHKWMYEVWYVLLSVYMIQDVTPWLQVDQAQFNS